MHIYPPPYRFNSSWYYATPWLYVDGCRDAAYLTSTWNSKISQQLLVPADLEIYLNGNFDQATRELSLQVGVLNTGFNTINGNLYAVLTEDSIQWSAPNGEQIHNSIPRIYWPDANGQEISVPAGILNNYNITWNIDSTYNKNKLKVIAYVQDSNMRPDSIYLVSQGAVTDFLQLQPVAVIEHQNDEVADFELLQNYPNPFNPITHIEFSIAKSEFVSLKIFNILGQEMVTLVSQRMARGSYKYTWDASQFASGIYYYELKAGSFVQTHKLILLQ